MLRIVILMAVMFALPFIVWHLWRLLATSVDEDGQAAPAPVGSLAIVGAALAVVATFSLVLFGGAGTSGEERYQPPRIVDGEVQPGEFVDDDDGPDAGPDRD